MKTRITDVSRRVVVLGLSLALVVAPGCGGGFLGLEDYARDLLLGALAVAVLNQADATADPAPGDPIPGLDGLSCWDLNGNGVGDDDEDINGDGVFDALDCQGAAGRPGPPGTSGDGSATGGVDGINCWDLNGNGQADANEDTNGDGAINASDCTGSVGPVGPTGPPGSNALAGTDGASLFDIFIDDFFAAEGTGTGQLPVNAVSIAEPVLGVVSGAAGKTGGDAVAYRVAVPDSYTAGNDVTMRIFLFRTGSFVGGCFGMTVDARRLRIGQSTEVYDHQESPSSTPGRRWVRIDALDGPGATVAGNGSDGVLVLLDLPLNTTGGLDYPNDIQGGDFLAFELGTYQTNSRAYQLLGVEFFESRAGSASLAGATVFTSDPGGEIPCDFVDCNTNGIPDALDIANQTSEDCDGNGIPDECAACPPLDLVFLMDTSGSMQDEGEALCAAIVGLVADLASRGIMVNHEILAISPDDEADIPPCVTGLSDSVSVRFDTTVPGNNGTCPGDLNAPGDSFASEKDENWGSATAIVAERFPWTPGAIRVIVPISDEGPCLGDDCDDPGRDRDAVDNAIIVANQNNVVVSPIATGGSSECVIALAGDLATGTGGTLFESTDPQVDLAGGINDLVIAACGSVGDCNANGTPDVCEICDGGTAGPAPECLADCNGNGVLDECDVRNGSNDCQPNGIPDECDIRDGFAEDVNTNGVPDSCELICTVLSNCVGTFSGSYSFDGGGGGSVQGNLQSAGAVVITFIEAFGKADITTLGAVSDCGAVFAINKEFGLELGGQISDDDGCFGSGGFSFGKGGSGTWTISFDQP